MNCATHAVQKAQKVKAPQYDKEHQEAKIRYAQE
jgi:hypothetical protein